MAEHQETKTTGHTYDGIEEYDNPTPAWMTWVFAATFLFAIFYMILNLFAQGALSPQAEFERAKAANQAKKFGELGTVQPDAATIISFTKDEAWMEYAAGVYQNRCVKCHGNSGEGTSAPNLTDDYYIHIKSVEDIATVLKNGVVSKGMPAWGNTFHPTELVIMSAYVAKLRETDPPGGKGQDGSEIPPWEAGAEPEAEPAP